MAGLTERGSVLFAGNLFSVRRCLDDPAEVKAVGIISFMSREEGSYLWPTLPLQEKGKKEKRLNFGRKISSK